jgi:hypothetical protein
MSNCMQQVRLSKPNTPYTNSGLYVAGRSATAFAAAWANRLLPPTMWSSNV